MTDNALWRLISKFKLLGGRLFTNKNKKTQASKFFTFFTKFPPKLIAKIFLLLLLNDYSGLGASKKFSPKTGHLLSPSDWSGIYGSYYFKARFEPFEMLNMICYHLYNLTIVKNTQRSGFICKIAVSLKVSLLHRWFSRLSCTNYNKLCKASCLWMNTQ